MLILGIETATEQVGVAIGGHEGVIATFEVAKGRRHAETLTPAIEFVCRQSDIELDEIGCIAVDVGPGLFTGMRVGLAAGKALAQALRVPMIGIPSLDLLAFSAGTSTASSCPSSTPARTRCSGRCTDRCRAACSRSARPPSGPSTTSSATCWRAARTCCASATAPTATATRSLEGFRCEISGRRIRRSGCSCCSPTPALLREEWVRPDEIEPIYLRPPDAQINWSVGEHGRPMSVLSRLLTGSTATSPVQSSIEPIQMRHLREVLPIEQGAYPKPWSRSVFESELRPGRDRAAPLRRRPHRAGGASSGTPACGSCPNPTAIRRT